MALFLLLFEIVAVGAMPSENTAVGIADPARTYVASSDEICVHHGAEGPVHKEPADPHKEKIFCAFCIPLVHGGFVFSPDFVFSKPVQTALETAISVGRSLFRANRVHSPAIPRAPPFV